MLHIVRTNEGAEFLSHFPQYAELYTTVKTVYDELISQAQDPHYDGTSVARACAQRGRTFTRAV